VLMVGWKFTGIDAGFDLSPPPPVPFSIPSSQNPLFLTVCDILEHQ
jgi:hypothetical protein